jgi:hypothetical protein
MTEREMWLETAKRLQERPACICGTLDEIADAHFDEEDGKVISRRAYRLQGAARAWARRTPWARQHRGTLFAYPVEVVDVMWGADAESGETDKPSLVELGRKRRIAFCLRMAERAAIKERMKARKAVARKRGR